MNVIFLEKERRLREVVSKLLLAYGCHVIEVKEGQDIIAIHERSLSAGNIPNVAVMDVDYLSAEDVSCMIERLRQQGQELKLVVTGNIRDDEYWDDAAFHGIDAVVTKPYAADELFAVMKKVVLGEKGMQIT